MADDAPKRLTPERLASLGGQQELSWEDARELFGHVDALETELVTARMRVYELEDDANVARCEISEARANNEVLLRQLGQMRRSRDDAVRRIDGITSKP